MNTDLIMILNNKLESATRNDAQRQLFSEIKQMFLTALCGFRDVQNDMSIINKHTHYITISEQFEELYKILNPRFRNVFFNESANKTSVNLYTKAHNKRNYITAVKEANPQFKFSEVNKYFIKFEYNSYVLWELVKENLTLLYAKYGNDVHYLQIIVSYLKVVIDNFQINKVNWNEVVDIFNQIMEEYDDTELRESVYLYGEKAPRQRKSGIVYNSKTKNLDFQIKALLDQGMKKKEICAKLGIGRTTLYDCIKRNPFLQ